MNKKLSAVLALTVIAPSVWATDITAIFGSGNPNTGWTATTANDIQLGLRAKNRVSGDTSNVNGVYSYATAPATRGLWNYEFSINSDPQNGTAALTTYDYYLAIDRDPSQGVNFQVVNALTAFPDNQYGNNGTANGTGTIGTAAALAGLNNVSQNSENITFSLDGHTSALDPNATYDFELYAVAAGAGANGTRLAETDIQVIVGAGGAAVPEATSTCTLLGVAFAGLAGLRRKFRA